MTTCARWLTSWPVTMYSGNRSGANSRRVQAHVVLEDALVWGMQDSSDGWMRAPIILNEIIWKTDE